MPPGPLTRAIALVLNEAADQRSISQSFIGRQNEGTSAFISQSHLSRFYAGAKGIDVDQLNGLCAILDVNIVDVIEWAESRLATSAVPDNVSFLPRPIEEMTVEEIDAVQKRAALKDPELDTDEDD